MKRKEETVKNMKKRDVNKMENMNKKYSCLNPDCFTTFDFPLYKINHLATSHNNPQYLRNYISTNPDKSRGCVFCRKAFGNTGDAQMHLQSTMQM